MDNPSTYPYDTNVDTTNTIAGTHTEAPELIKRVVQGAHETIDHLADVAAPKVQKLQQGVEGAGAMLHERADQLRNLQESWKTSLRGTVRESPLTAVATALVVGMLLSRLNR